MGETVKLEIHLRAFVRKDTRTRWIAVCPMVNVVTQGKSAADARRCLDEAVQLWFEDCIERGTLDQALRESGFSLATREILDSNESVIVTRESQPDVLGDAFALNVTIPAYRAAALMASAQVGVGVESLRFADS
ncbi:MAG TPA: type II toxin-antitoxin system HicB family antitoxin [Thermoanaerobaculia bacterium]|nr:type II toxin-antitoxin system HicB family antitoxin [Thermoanaerobaculia bacterium]